MIDQHAACEKILYMENYEDVKSVREAREVKEKVTYQIPNLYKSALMENEDNINKLGWYFKLSRQQGASFEI